MKPCICSADKITLVRVRRNKNNSEFMQENGESMDDSVPLESRPRASTRQQVSSDQETGSNRALIAKNSEHVEACNQQIQEMEQMKFQGSCPRRN